MRKEYIKPVVNVYNIQTESLLENTSPAYSVGVSPNPLTKDDIDDFEHE
ncbi:MAG: hypothetical protein HUK08_05700 [Bacteroidaceae bacterium]|nr:hypothetical protein [Bacteroidaceae bacterium]